MSRLSFVLFILVFAIGVPAASAQDFYQDYTLFLDAPTDYKNCSTTEPISGVTGSQPDVESFLARISTNPASPGVTLIANLFKQPDDGFTDFLYFGLTASFDGQPVNYAALVQNGSLVGKGEVDAAGQFIAGTGDAISVSPDFYQFQATFSTAPDSISFFTADFLTGICDEVPENFTFNDPTTFIPLDLPTPEEALALDTMLINLFEGEAAAQRFYLLETIFDCAEYGETPLFSADQLASILSVEIYEDSDFGKVMKVEIDPEVLDALDTAETPLRFFINTYDVSGQKVGTYMVQYSGRQFSGGQISADGTFVGTGLRLTDDGAEGLVFFLEDIEVEAAVVPAMALGQLLPEAESTCPATEDVM